ncbi:lactadherin-like [Dendronephthya gigantea]|uniref:lactadherin-like n=1 Tax=Dendronephthya gigantea TaxID=151771 RepID=UPI001069B51F|nr:lactadherin-like [Dendronephthya gigantea]
MQSGLILWSQLTSSSSSEGNKASHAVLNGPRTWLPAANDTEPWLQVDFSTNLQLVSLKTQGSPTSEQWVKSFTISYANSSGIFRNFTHGENFTVFRANTDATTIVETTLPEETKVRFLRINPKTWSKRPALRVEYYGCYTTCASAGPLSFLDSQITATSTYASSIYAHHARLNDKLGWISEHSKPASLLIDYGKRTTITGIKVQGNSEFAVWSSTFTVQYSNDGLRFKDYREAGSIKTFNGPVDASTVTERSFSHAIFTRFLKILAALSTNFYPTNPANTQYNFAALRIEVQGCHYDDDWFYSLPLGMKNNLILDSQINASSSRFYTSGAGNGRLNLTTIPNVRHGGWIAADGDKNPWFQVDFITNVTVSALLVQGLSGTAYGVTKYTIASSDDGKVFSVNKKEDQQTEKVFFATGEQSIFPHIIGRFIRIQPTGWNGLCAMRVEFFGRYEGCGNPEPLGMENGRILDRQLTAAQEHDSQPAPYGRLGHATGWNGGSMSNFDVWYQVDFIKHAKITAIKMQGEQASYHIKKFKVSFSNNGIDFIEYVDVMGLKVTIYNIFLCFCRNTIQCTCGCNCGG